MVKLNLKELLGQNELGKRTAIANASILKRIMAFLVDILILQLIVVYPFRRTVENLIGTELDFNKINQIALDSEITRTLTGISIAIGVLAVIYFMVFEIKMNQTPGKMLFNIYVVAEKAALKPKTKTEIEDFQKKISFWQALLRSIFLMPIFPFALLWIVDPLFLAVSKNSQRLTEQLSKTRVVEKINY